MLFCVFPLLSQHLVLVQVQEQRGLFQDVGLYSCFGPALIPSLWHLWELVLTGEPVMVFAPTPALCSQTVLGLVSLIAPIGYDDDFRPFLTIYDPDFREISAACAELAKENNTKQKNRPNTLSHHHRTTSSSGSNNPATIDTGCASSSPSRKQQHRLPVSLVGYTNPFFLKALEFWPNMVSHGSTLRVASEHTQPVKAKVFRTPGTSFRTALDPKPSAGIFGRSSSSQQKGCPPCLWTRSDPVLLPNRQVLSTLMSLPDNEVRRARRLACGIEGNDASSSNSRGPRANTSGHNGPIRLLRSSSAPTTATRRHSSRSGGGGDRDLPPAVAINDAYLRQHFRQLTSQFLRPFDRYFGAGYTTPPNVNSNGCNDSIKILETTDVQKKSSSLQDPWRVQIGPYCEPAACLPTFRSSEFLRSVVDRLPPMLRDYNRDNKETFRKISSSSSSSSSSAAQQSTRKAWHRIYTKFVRGPHFKSWFKRRTNEQCAEIRVASRQLRIDYPADMLIRQTAPKMFNILKTKEMDDMDEMDDTEKDDKNDTHNKSKHAVPRREIMSLVRLWLQIRKEMKIVLRAGTITEEISKVDAAALRVVIETPEYQWMTRHLRMLEDVVPEQFLTRALDEAESDEWDDVVDGVDFDLKEARSKGGGNDDEGDKVEKEVAAEAAVVVVEEEEKTTEMVVEKVTRKDDEEELSVLQARTHGQTLQERNENPLSSSSSSFSVSPLTYRERLITPTVATTTTSGIVKRSSAGSGGFAAGRSGSVSVPPPLITPSLSSSAATLSSASTTTGDSHPKTPTTMFRDEVVRPPTVSPRTKDTRQKLALSFESFWPE